MTINISDILKLVETALSGSALLVQQLSILYKLTTFRRTTFDLSRQGLLGVYFMCNFRKILYFNITHIYMLSSLLLIFNN